MAKAAVDRHPPAYSLSGLLYGKTGDSGDWLMLSVPNAMVRGVFAAMDEPGIELPPSGNDHGQLHAHITVMRPDEIARVGGLNKITERGKRFDYTLGKLVTFEPAGWDDMSNCWVLEVYSPQLKQLRQSYGLSALPNDGRFAFHVTVAVRRHGVLGRGVAAKNQSQPA